MKTVIKTTDGIQIMTLVDGADLAEALRKWGEAHPGKYVSHRDMQDSVIPTDREFRNAWEDVTPQPVIDFNMTKARLIHLGRIRVKRDAALAVLDVEMVKALGSGNTALRDSVEVQKRVLRDLPQTIAVRLAAANTIQALKAIQPL